jgi:hypothetical protein
MLHCTVKTVQLLKSVRLGNNGAGQINQYMSENVECVVVKNRKEFIHYLFEAKIAHYNIICHLAEAQKGTLTNGKCIMFC